MDDEEQHVVTAGAIVTVTLLLERRYVASFFIMSTRTYFIVSGDYVLDRIYFSVIKMDILG